ncbi:MAG: hypothetical protein H0X37_00970 [Herpetosiphonaceae bacterium]|nr:hypothetical protein [Herpetosiphonaceae bacterium]
MSIPESAQRARTRYAAALYRSALLRDPHPARAGRAVITAFGAITWDNVLLDDQLEARLVANFPPLPRFQQRPSQSPVNLPATFCALSPSTRLALGLRIVRGMATPLIAQALWLALPEAQTLLIEGGRAMSGATDTLGGACRSCWSGRLDDPNAGRSHMLTCSTCRVAIPRWEQAERTLSEHLGRALGSLSLPPAIDEALTASLDPSTHTGHTLLWHRPAVLQSVLVLCTLLTLLLLFWPWRTDKLSATASAALPPAAIVAAARNTYAAVPQVSGFLHRRWAITLGQPQLNFQADEWVDPAHPERHRMQLVADRRVAEWEVGDGQDHLLYMSNLVPYFCGASPIGVQSHTNERNSWTMGPTQQAAIRTVRWHHGPWATGLHYLDLAATADTLRSLGIAGSGSAATLTLSAEGRAISGTLLLRFDPVSHALREVRELQHNNGQTEERVPWQLRSTETLDEQTVAPHDLLTSYPDDNQPPLVERTSPIIDDGCPLTGSEQTQSLPRLLMMPNLGPLIGLSALPTGLNQALVVGPPDPAAPNGFNQQFRLEINNLHVVYIGSAKRLVLVPEAPPIAGDHLVAAGPWRVHFFPPEVPTVLTAVLQPAAIGNEQFHNGSSRGNYVRVLAEGWTRDELLAVLATARPLRVDDWANAPDRFYATASLPAAVQAHLLTLFAASRITPGQSHHLVVVETTRQAPFFAGLADPYHTPAALWPAERRQESWIAYGKGGREARALRLTSDMMGHVVAAQWHDEQTWRSYDAASTTVIAQPYRAGAQRVGDAVLPLAAAWQWQWHTLDDGSAVAEQLQPLEALPGNAGLASSEVVYLDNWTNDLATDSALGRAFFDRQGHLRGRETLAILKAATSGTENHLGVTATTPVTSTVMINRAVIEQDEWLPSIPASTFEWTLPPGTKEASADNLLTFYPYFNDPPVKVRNITDAAATMPFTVWDWGPTWTPLEEAPALSGILQQPPHTGQSPPVMRGTIGSAVSLGVAIDAHYVLDNRSVDLLQGPASLLRQLLQQTAPAWISAEQRVVMINTQPRTVWLMRGTTQKSGINIYYNRWIVFEMDGTLFFLRADVQDADLDKIVQHLDGLRQVVPQRQP